MNVTIVKESGGPVLSFNFYDELGNLLYRHRKELTQPD